MPMPSFHEWLRIAPRSPRRRPPGDADRQCRARRHFPRPSRRLCGLSPETLADVLKVSGGDGAGGGGESRWADWFIGRRCKPTPENSALRSLPTCMGVQGVAFSCRAEPRRSGGAGLLRAGVPEGLEGLIQRTRDPELRRAFEDMRHFRFAKRLLPLHPRCADPQRRSPPVRHRGFPAEDRVPDAVAGRRNGVKGEPSSTSTKPPFDLHLGNPLEAIFKAYLHNEFRNIIGGRIPALRTRQKTGTVTIGYGKDTGEVSPDEIPDRAASGEQEMLATSWSC